MSLSELHFIRPWWLAALLPLALLLWRLMRGGGGASNWQDLVDPHLLPHLLVGGKGKARLLTPALLGLGWLLLVLALAGPSWERLPQPVYQPEQYRVLLLDISRQMNAADLPPSRLAQARFETLDLLKRSGEGQTALIAYAAEPYVISPLTRDADTIALQVPALSSELLPLQGRNAAPALKKALELLSNARAHDADVILITGGMDDPAAAQGAAMQLRAAGHRLSVLAIGTEAGAPVPAGDGGFLQDDSGAILLPRLDPRQLGALADSGGGRYVHSRPDDRDLDALLREPLTRQAEHQVESVQGDQWREFGPWLLLVLLPLAALAFRRGWFSPLPALLLTLALSSQPQPALAFGWDDLWSRPDQRGAKALSADRPEQAAALFDDAAWRAAAHYRSGNYQESLSELQALDGAEPAYNRGNTLARLGKLEDAVAAYDQVLEQDPGHEDARFNRDLLQRLLDQQQSQQQQQAGENQESGEDRQSGENPESGKSGDNRQQKGQDSAQGQDDGQSEQQQDQTEGQEQDPSQNAQSGDEGQQRDASAPEPADDGEQPDAGQNAEQPEPEEPGRADLLGEQDAQGDTQAAAGLQPQEQQIPESAQAMEQWLRRVPDDPAGLLRQRILLQHLRNKGELP